MAPREKSGWILLLFLLSGLVIGGLLGELASKVDWLWWLSFGEEFGLQEPIKLDLKVMTITFGLMIRINVASIIGVLISIFAYSLKNNSHLASLKFIRNAVTYNTYAPLHFK